VAINLRRQTQKGIFGYSLRIPIASRIQVKTSVSDRGRKAKTRSDSVHEEPGAEGGRQKDTKLAEAEREKKLGRLGPICDGAADVTD
jgi:hypothetical protein